MDKQEKILWHGAFFEAMQLELHEYAQMLTFVSEHQLSKEALKMDLLIIKKKPGAKIDKNIGRVFRTHNIVEFKSEKDSLSERDYNKVMAYAFLYASFTPAPVSDITVTFATSAHPRELLRSLREEHRLNVRETSSGIFSVKGEKFPVQILEGKRLPPDENLFLRNLRSTLSTEDLVQTAARYSQIKALEFKNVYWDRLMQANKNAFKEAIEMNDGWREFIYELANEDSWLKARIDEQSRAVAEAAVLERTKNLTQDLTRDLTRDITRDLTKDFAREMLLCGRPFEEVAKVTRLPYETVASLAQAP